MSELSVFSDVAFAVEGIADAGFTELSPR